MRQYWHLPVINRRMNQSIAFFILVKIERRLLLFFANRQNAVDASVDSDIARNT